MYNKYKRINDNLRIKKGYTRDGDSFIPSDIEDTRKQIIIEWLKQPNNEYAELAKALIDDRDYGKVLNIL